MRTQQAVLLATGAIAGILATSWLTEATAGPQDEYPPFLTIQGFRIVDKGGQLHGELVTNTPRGETVLRIGEPDAGRIELAASSKATCVRLLDSNRKNRASIYMMQNGRTSVSVQDDQGRPAVFLMVDSDGQEHVGRASLENRLQFDPSMTNEPSTRPAGPGAEE